MQGTIFTNLQELQSYKFVSDFGSQVMAKLAKHGADRRQVFREAKAQITEMTTSEERKILMTLMKSRADWDPHVPKLIANLNGRLGARRLPEDDSTYNSNNDNNNNNDWNNGWNNNNDNDNNNDALGPLGSEIC